MKTAEQKVDEFLKMRPFTRESVILLLKEQDRDTRMACAEAVDAVISTDMPSDACWEEDACDACMNVKAC